VDPRNTIPNQVGVRDPDLEIEDALDAPSVLETGDRGASKQSGYVFPHL